MKLTAHRVHPTLEMDIVPAWRSREWMNYLPERFANRCLPLRIANESGWFLLSAHTFQVEWSGIQHQSGLTIKHYEGSNPYSARSNFGAGILTFSIPYLFETEPGYNLLVRGPANMPKPGISALEGVVETDWAPYTFTMNWQLTTCNEPVLFQKGEPIAQIVPLKRHELESFTPELTEESSPLVDAHLEWATSREDFLRRLLKDDPEVLKEGWQKDYFQGHGAPEHQTKLQLASFEEVS